MPFELSGLSEVFLEDSLMLMFEESTVNLVCLSFSALSQKLFWVNSIPERELSRPS